MNNVKMFQAHKEAVRRVSFSPTDAKFASCSDDGTVRVWDFFSCVEERVLRGHGSDVKCVDWHPTKGILGIYDFIEYLLNNHEGARHCRKPLGRRSVTKGPIYRFFELVTTAPFHCANSLG